MNSSSILTVPLGREAHHFAHQFAAATLQLSPAENKTKKAKQVYLNTLAVYAVHTYLKWLEYDIDLSLGDSWEPVLFSRWDVADLVIPRIGKIECRPIWEEDTVIVLPAEVTEDRIGYMIVQFREQLDAGNLLGFALISDPLNFPTQIQVAELLSLDDLIDYLYRLELANDFLLSDDPVAVQVRLVLENQDLSEVVAQLERVYRTTNQIQWRYAGADILAGTMASGGTERESSEDLTKIKLQKLAKNLLEKLASLWNNVD